MRPKLPLTCAVLVLSAGVAWAADFQAPAPLSGYNWSAFHVGVNAGTARDNLRGSIAPDGSDFTVAGLSDADLQFLTSSVERKDTGFTGGAEIGYDQQFGAVVLGLAADINALDLNGGKYRTEAFPDSFAGGFAGVVRAFTGEPLVYNTRFRRDVDWFGTVRARAGFAVDRALLYVTGGFAYGELTTHASAAFTFPPDIPLTFDYQGGRSDMRTGWTVGGGVEYALTDNITLKGEYLHVDLGDKSFTMAAAGGLSAAVPGSSYTIREETKFHVGRLGVNYKF